MPLPMHGLSLEELEHYSGIEPGASEELARRITQSRELQKSQLEQLQEDLDDAERQLSTAEDDLSSVEDSLEEMTIACRQATEALRDALPLLPEQSRERESITELIKTLEKLT